MKALKQTLIALTLLSPLAASAAKITDLEYVRSYIAAGTDVAQVQRVALSNGTQQEIEQAAKNNFLLQDFNGDNHADLLVITEENPTKQNDDWIFGKRYLQCFVGQQDGSLKLVFSNDKMVRQADEGGVFGDPLNGFSVRPNGTITYSIYGGSAWRWSYTDTIQFRNGDFYMIGLDTYNGWNGDGRGDEKSINLLTGQVIEHHYKDADDKGTVKRYRVRVKPLAKLSTYPGSGPN